MPYRTFVIMKILSVLNLILLISFQAFSYSYSVFTENGKVGLKNEAGKVLIPAQYESIGWSNGEFSLIDNVTGFRNGKSWGLINLENHRITKPEFDELRPGEAGLIIAKRKTRTSVKPLIGCINSSGKEVIPFQYDGVTISALRAIVFTKVGNEFRYGVIDLANKTIIPQQYQDIKSIGTLRFAVRNFQQKIALFSDQGKQISEFSIDSISYFHKNYAVVFEGKNQGIIDREGQIKVPAKFRDVQIQDDGTFKVRQPDRWALYDGANKMVRQVQADSVIVLDKNVYKVKTAGYVQLCNSNFEPLISNVFNDIGKYSNRKTVYTINGRHGIVELNGTVVIPAIYHKVFFEKEFIITSEKKGNQMISVLFDSIGSRKTIKPYDEIVPVSRNRFAVKNRSFWGVVDFDGKEIVSCVYDSLLQFKDNAIVVKFHGLYGIINDEGKWIVTPKANKVRLIGDNKFIQYAPEITELKALNGSVIYFTSNPVEVQNDYMLETISTGDVWKIDYNGVIIDRQFYPNEVTEKVYEESEGYRVIKRNGRFGFIDSKGRLRIANRYEDVSPFKEGLAAIKILGKWGFINYHDNIVIQPVYEAVFPFTNGRALVKQRGLYGLIDKNGKLILPVRYENLETLPSKNLLIVSGGLQGISDAAGNILVSPRFNNLWDTGKNFLIVEKAGKYGVVGYNGISTIPMVYDHITFDPYQNLFLVLQKTNWEMLKL
jgi:hypothetical protein